MNPGVSAGVVAALFLTVAGLERVPQLRFAPYRFLRQHIGTDAGWYLIATTANVIAAFVLLPMLSTLALPGVAAAVRQWPFAGRLALAVVVYDFFSFLVHAGLHRSQTLWAVHKVHHSSLQLDWLPTTRAHLMENLLRQVSAQIPLFALGMKATVVAPTLVVYAAFALLGHSNLRLRGRWLELVFVTPRIHRIHHVPATSQQNFGTIFTVWDRAFAWFINIDTDPAEPVGVPGEIDAYPQRLAAAFRQPFREIRRRRTTQIALDPAGT